MGGDCCAPCFRPLEKSPHEVRAWVATAGRAGTRLDPQSSENERWMPDYVGYHLAPVKVAAGDVVELKKSTAAAAAAAEDRDQLTPRESAGSRNEDDTRRPPPTPPPLPLCGGATPGAWWGSSDAVRRAGTESGGGCHGGSSEGRHPDDAGEGESRKKWSGLFDADAPRGPLLAGGGLPEEEKVAEASGGAQGSSASSTSPAAAAAAVGHPGAALRWRPTEPCRECRVRRRDTALRCLRRRPLVMLGDSVMLQQCEQLKLSLGALPDAASAVDGEPCDISVRVEEWPEGKNPKRECVFKGAAANVMCVDLSEAGGKDRQLNSLHRGHETGREVGMTKRLTSLRRMLRKRAREGDPEGGDRRDGDDADADAAAPVLVMLGGLHDVSYNSDEVFRKSLEPGGGVETYVRAARDAGFSRVVWELIAATNPRVGKSRTCAPGNAFQLPNDSCFQARLAVATNAKVRGASGGWYLDHCFLVSNY